MTFKDIALAKRKREKKEATRDAKRRKKSASTSETSHILPHTDGKRHTEGYRGVLLYSPILVEFDSLIEV
jgi:hypothetical protein